jgi:hypothetical protein
MRQKFFMLAVFLGMLALVQPIRAEIELESFESYADNAALNAVWVHVADVIAVTLENTVPGGAEGANAIEADYWDRTVNWWGARYRNFSPALDISGEKYISFYAWGNNNYQVQLKSAEGTIYQNALVSGSGQSNYWQRYSFNIADVTGGSGTFNPADLSGIQINIGPGGTANDRKSKGVRNYFDHIIATSDINVDNAETYADSTEAANAWTRNNDIASVGVTSSTPHSGAQAIEFTYTAPGSGYGGAGKTLPKLNITQETHLSFYTRGPGPQLYSMQIKSNAGAVWDTYNFSATPNLSTEDWTLQEIDLANFIPSTGTTDRTALSGISFYFHGPDGNFYIDDLMFTTPSTVANWSEY